MYKINIITLEKNLTYKGTVILKYKIEYPEITGTNYTRFNQFNSSRANQLKYYAETELFELAIQQYEYNVANGYPVMVYELYSIPTITYSKDEIISLYFDDYTFMGGAHGSTIRSSQNWNMETDRQFTLNRLYPQDPYFILSILKDIDHQIEEQIANGNDVYFEDYCKLVLETFNPNSFYLTENMDTFDIVIYFQQYDIAPYSTGIPTFKIYQNSYQRRFSI